MVATADYLAGMGSRHAGLLTEEQRERISRLVICGAGAGGVGGWTYEALARLGCTRFRIADPESFEPSNANRQRACSTDTIGRNKAEVTAEILRAINPEAQITLFRDGVSPANLGEFLAGGSIVLDGIDVAQMETKKAIFDGARAAGLPVVTCPIFLFGTALAFFDPRRSPTFEEFFGPVPPANTPERRRFVQGLAPRFFSFLPGYIDFPLFRRRVLGGQVPSVGIAAMLSGALAATAIVSYACGIGNLPVVPETLHIDLMEGRIRRGGPLRRWLLRQAMRLRWGDGGADDS